MAGFTSINYMLSRNIPLYGLLSVFGGFFLQFTMGSFYSFGNMMTYMTSYMRMNGSPNITYEDFIVVQSTWGMTQGTVMPLSGFIIAFIGEKGSMALGSLLFSFGCGLTYFTINKDIWMVAATYGFVSAFGQNIALIPTLTTAMKWFPTRKGTVMGIVVGGFGGGAMVFNQIQTAIVNPENLSVDKHGPNKSYFTDESVLNRVPGLLLILSGIYGVMGLFSVLLIRQPPTEWVGNQISKEKRKNVQNGHVPMDERLPKNYSSIELENHFPNDCVSGNEGNLDDDEELPFVTWKEAFKCKEFYILWVTRMSVVLITQVVAALYKAFGQTFIYDDRFLSMVGAVSAVFNCSGRLLYGFIMDKTTYKFSMSIEAICLTILVASLPATSYIGTGCTPFTNNSSIELFNSTPANLTLSSEGFDNCESTETYLTTKVFYALWVWGIFLTFPGTYSMQPAVTTQTFGHKYGGTIYAFLFSADIINNLLVATMIKGIKGALGYLGLFVFVSMWGIVALIATLFYPKNTSPEDVIQRIRGKESHENDP